MRSLKTPEKLLLAAAGLITALGGALAVVQPGDLAGDDVASTEEAAPGADTSASTTTTSDGTTTTETSRGLDAPAVEGQVTTTTSTTTTSTTSASVPAETTTTVAGSGLAATTPPSGGTDGLADTGQEGMLAPGLALLALGLVARRATGMSAERLRHDSNVRPSD